MTSISECCIFFHFYLGAAHRQHPSLLCMLHMPALCPINKAVRRDWMAACCSLMQHILISINSFRLKEDEHRNADRPSQPMDHSWVNGPGFASRRMLSGNRRSHDGPGGALCTASSTSPESPAPRRGVAHVSVGGAAKALFLWMTA
jgi:hypothetical protein